MKEYAPLIIPCVVLVSFACLVSNLCGINTGMDNMHKEAVIKGHAEGVADANGKAVFKWKECK
jgi:hypothetical protein